MLSWMLRVRMFELAYAAAAEVFNLLECVCDCGSFLFFPAKTGFIKKGTKYCVCVFVYDDTL